jgi:amino acid adenylation domain-containing protein
MKADSKSNPSGTSARSIDEWVSSQAEIRPKAVAVSYADQRLTFKELEERADVLSKLLQSRGVGPESVVGICAKRSMAMVVGALAVLKAGGAYLPMDPLNPSARLAKMAEDAEIAILLATQGIETKVPGNGRPNIILDDYGQIIDMPTKSSPTLPHEDSITKRLAYVIYTSGSTGDPNGVEVTHQNLLNLVAWHQSAFQLTPEDRTSQIANVGFDAAVWEIWPCLAAGGSVHIPDEQVIRDPEALRNWLVDERITISFVPTPMAEHLLRLDWPAQTALRRMLTGADTLHRHPPEGLPFQLINNYGPTECTVVATSGRVLPHDSKHSLPSIGLPIRNTQAYILDESGRQVPAGIEGELHIGGAGVARGYRKRPELTAKRFIPDHFAAELGGRLFKTGDIAKLLPDGQIAFVRRMDDQVKIRGFRIEPNEIAAVLNRHPQVAHSVVMVRQVLEGERRLVAYLVPSPEGSPTPGELRDFLGSRLPEYMVPDIFVELENLPLSANGKISRSDLPEPCEANTLLDLTFTAPRTEVEKSVVNILGGLLGVKQVDVEGNFFVLGGHSLVGAQLINRVRNEFGVEMSLRALFDGPTVAELSVEIERLLALKNEQAKNNEVHGLLESAAPNSIGR